MNRKSKKQRNNRIEKVLMHNFSFLQTLTGEKNKQRTKILMYIYNKLGLCLGPISIIIIG